MQELREEQALGTAGSGTAGRFSRRGTSAGAGLGFSYKGCAVQVEVWVLMDRQGTWPEVEFRK